MNLRFGLSPSDSHLHFEEKNICRTEQAVFFFLITDH